MALGGLRRQHAPRTIADGARGIFRLRHQDRLVEIGQDRAVLRAQPDIGLRVRRHAQDDFAIHRGERERLVRREFTDVGVNFPVQVLHHGAARHIVERDLAVDAVDLEKGGEAAG